VEHTPRALATVAFLKARLGDNDDHLSLFEPLVIDAIIRLGKEAFAAKELIPILRRRAGLELPSPTLQTVLKRLSRSRYLQREGGGYLVGERQLIDPELDPLFTKIQAGHQKLARALAAFLSTAEVEVDSQDEALAMLARFVSENKVALVLDGDLPPGQKDRHQDAKRTTRLVARFVTERVLPSTELRPELEGLVEGIVLRDSILLSDVADASKKLANLTVVLDTPILFAALGYADETSCTATQDGLKLFKPAGARVVALDCTVEEMRRILAVYQDKVATVVGRESLYPTELSRAVMRKKLGAGEIRALAERLESDIRAAGIAVQSVPSRDRRYTLDEAELSRALADTRDGKFDSPRVRHDVDVVASVLVHRAGRTALAVENCHWIFASTSGQVIKNVQAWYKSQGESGIPPITHLFNLTSIAWLKVPTAAPDVKLHELAAICAAVMRPSRETWARFIENLRKLRDERIITSDEAAAVQVSSLLEPLLSRLDEDDEPDAESIREVIQRVRDSYKAEATAKVKEVELASIVAVEEARRKARAEAEAARRHVEEMESKYERDISRLNEAFACERAERAAAALEMQQLDQRITERAMRVAGPVVTATYWIAVLLLIVAGVAGVVGTPDGLPRRWAWIVKGAIALATSWGVISAIRGHSIQSVRERATPWLAGVLRKLFAGS
jgi:hypothetical protein